MFAGSEAYRPIILAFFLVLFATVTLGASTAIAASCESLAHLRCRTRRSRRPRT